jgi:hypothetical protein
LSKTTFNEAVASCNDEIQTFREGTKALDMADRLLSIDAVLERAGQADLKFG